MATAKTTTKRKTQDAVKRYGEQGYALFDKSGKQVSRALFSEIKYHAGKKTVISKNGKEHAMQMLAIMKKHKIIGANELVINKAKTMYGG
ncbi:MAG: hypothetical protein FWC39_07270 [Bacteroidetes bacterium]|nr:hypothetical protein [Bacteroidota bacterium]